VLGLLDAHLAALRFPSLGDTVLIDGSVEVSQVPGEPSRTCPVLRPRRDCWVRPFELAALLLGSTVLPSAPTTASAPATTSFRGSITRPARSLSTLRSQGHPCTTQDSLPADGPILAGRDFNPLGSIVKFPL